MSTVGNANAAPGGLEWRNNNAVAGWAFMAIWTGVLCLFTWLFIREGGFHQFSPPVETGIMVLFWLVGIGGCAHFFGMPRVQVIVDDAEVLVRQRWAFSSWEERFALNDLLPPLISEEKDSEGDPYFKASIVTPSGRTIVFAEDNDRTEVQIARDRLLAAMK